MKELGRFPSWSVLSLAWLGVCVSFAAAQQVEELPLPQVKPPVPQTSPRLPTTPATPDFDLLDAPTLLPPTIVPLERLLRETESLPESETLDLYAAPPLADASSMESVYWWERAVQEPVEPNAHWARFDLGTIVADTLIHSPRIIGLSQDVVIAREAIVQEEAAFDARWLFDSGFRRSSDPVGNTLVTGGPPRLREADWSSRAGIVRTTRLGGQWSANQRFGTLDSNSLFFLPPNQGNTRLEISLSQPLLAGAGRMFNERLIVKAQLDARTTTQESLREVQVLIAEVMNSYWRLYEQRAKVIQIRDLMRRGQQMFEIVEARQGIDTANAELLRIREQIAVRQAKLLRARADLANEQTRLAMLVGAEALQHAELDELIPQDRPYAPPLTIELAEAVVTALHHRPELMIATADLESFALQINVSRNQLLPQLDAMVDTYVMGLRGRRNLGGALADQFATGEPGFFAGLLYEIPAGRRAAHARYRAAHAGYVKAVQELRQIILTTKAEVDIAVREVNVASEMIGNRHQTLMAAKANEEFLQRRWELLGGDGIPVGLVVQDLLDAQASRTQAEQDFVESQAAYFNAFVRLQLAMGTLLISQQIDPNELLVPAQINDVPQP